MGKVFAPSQPSCITTPCCSCVEPKISASSSAYGSVVRGVLHNVKSGGRTAGCRSTLRTSPSSTHYSESHEAKHAEAATHARRATNLTEARLTSIGCVFTPEVMTTRDDNRHRSTHNGQSHRSRALEPLSRYPLLGRRRAGLFRPARPRESHWRVGFISLLATSTVKRLRRSSAGGCGASLWRALADGLLERG